jgi:hypothetical protein
LNPFSDEVARLPPGTECTLVATQSYERAHGVGTVVMYQVDCDGTVGWVPKEALTFAPGKE